ncbi:dolichyl-diphosphooligosaccharide--protein glycosyltransferase subunit 2 [Cydia pomonella]|uniref:dolichyl-diphosphooligosaccharide--protein glycosyltransferase subunit 2 n=1 Tax=Cydia pomonella TaxID=82600 RepID=UPI002ADE9348|nr:dolichyl-diphosphooligosaccharide--protein glycosyltransferase subunit 2 [Cydia pomonella]
MYFRAFLLVSILALGNANTLQGTIDVKRLEGILQENLKSKDLSSLYYAVKGLKQLNAKIPNICEDLKTIKYDLKNIEQVYYLTNTAALSNCLNSLKPEVLSAPAQTLDKKDATIPELYYSVYSLKALGKGSVYDKEDGLKNLIQLLKKDDSPANYGYVFGLCEHMGCAAWSAQHAEGVLLAADESDARALHFEGGLPVTALVLSTVLRTYKSLSKPSPLTEEQKLKFATYLVSRRSVNTARGAALLLEAAQALADDQPSPISIVIKGKKYISSDSDSIEISITDLLGRPVKGLKADRVLAQSGTRLADDVVVLSKQPLTQKPNEPTTFILNLSKIKAQYGLYKIALSADSKTASVNVAVLGEIQVGSVEVGIGDVDGTTSPKLTTVAYPNKLAEKLQADHMQKVTLKFTVKDKYGAAVLVQQAFVRVAAAAGDLEAIFVAEPDNAKAYKVDLNVGAISKHLQHRSGAYSLTLFLGDSAAAAPVAWRLGDVLFNFGHEGAAPAGAAQPGRGPLPQIAHEFRSAEPRPPRLVSDVFAVACAAPLLLLLVLWAKLRVNLSYMPFTPSMLLFHLSLGGALALYGVVWLRLSMFEAARWLPPLGAATFLAGQRLLRRLVADKRRPAA